MPDLPTLPPISTAPLSVVLLADDEAPHLEPVLAAWFALLDGLGREYEVLVADDGSADRTGLMAESLRWLYPPLRVFRHDERRGVGAALRTALKHARHPLLFYTTCDPQFRTDDLPKLLAEIDKVHLVSGYRAGRPVPLPGRLLGAAYRGFARVVFSDSPPPLPGWLGWKEHRTRLLARVLFAVRMHDVGCAFRLCRREIFSRIPVQSDGPFAHVEILAKANFLGHLMAEEVPVAHQPRRRDPRREREDARRARADFWRLLNKPDFGPPFLPAEEAPPSSPTVPVSSHAAPPA